MANTRTNHHSHETKSDARAAAQALAQLFREKLSFCCCCCCSRRTHTQQVHSFGARKPVNQWLLLLLFCVVSRARTLLFAWKPQELYLFSTFWPALKLPIDAIGARISSRVSGTKCALAACTSQSAVCCVLYVLCALSNCKRVSGFTLIRSRHHNQHTTLSFDCANNNNNNND